MTKKHFWISTGLLVLIPIYFLQASTHASFNQKWADLQAKSAKVSPECLAFLTFAGQKKLLSDKVIKSTSEKGNPAAAMPLKGSSVAATPSAQSSQSASTQSPSSPSALATSTIPSREQLLDMAAVVSRWPGFSQTQIDSYKLVLREENPPTDLDQKSFVAGIANIKTCHFKEVAVLASQIQENLNQKALNENDQETLVSSLKLFLFNIAKSPCDLSQASTSVKIAQYLGEFHLDKMLARKQKQIRLVKKSIKPETAASTPLSATDIWSEIHQAEKVRMELARILFFP